MNKLTDLRFVIGAFFAIVGVLLLIFGLVSTGHAASVNTWCGIVFILFGGVMLGLPLRK
jgi:hypothetical protein